MKSSSKTNKPTRSSAQNDALHVYFRQIAEELNEKGLDLVQTLPKVDIPWTEKLVKEALWRPIQKTWVGKESTTRLTTTDIDEVYDIVNKWLAGLGIHIPFPTQDEGN